MYYICSLPNPGTDGEVKELFSVDPSLIERFARAENRPGRGVYDCIGRLRDGARSRCKDTVIELDQVICDLDLKHIAEPRNEVVKVLQALLLRPSEIRDSGFGLHAVWRFKEAVNDNAGLEQAEHIMARLAELLAGDPAPTHRAALLRRPGSDNTKDGSPRKCHPIEQSDRQYDVSEFEDMFDLYGDRPLLTRKEQPKANGYDRAAKGEHGDPVDIDAEFASIRDGASANEAQCRIIPSLLRRGDHPGEVLEYVADRTVAAHGPPWTLQHEVVAVRRRILSAYNNLLLKDYDPATGVIPDWLPGEFHQDWVERLQQGRKPAFGFNRGGFYIRAPHRCDEAESGPSNTAPGDHSTEKEQSSAEGRQKEPPKKSRKPELFVLRPFVPFDPATLPPRQWLYGRHYLRQTVSATVAPGGYGKSTLDMIEGIAMATCRNLLGEQPEERLRVWFHNGEEPLEEMRRRVAAICQHYNIPQEELVGWFFMTSGHEVPLRVAEGYTKLEINAALIARINDQIRLNKIDVAIFDPLITLHGVPETDNTKMDQVIRIFAGIADENKCAIELSHHVRKSPSGSNGDYGAADIRGASAVHDAIRGARMLNHMSDQDARDLAIELHHRAQYFRVDKAKGNYSPAAKAVWRQFVSVEIANGDDVGVIVAWEFPGHGEPTPQRQEQDRKAEFVFLQILDRYQADGRTVSERQGPNYAPAKFARESEAKLAGLGNAVLAQAMRRLFEAKKIKATDEGASGRTKHRIVRA